MNNDNWISEGEKIYTASRTMFAPIWLDLRSQGYNIISTWIDEYKAGVSNDLSDLMHRCVKESSECDVLVLFVTEGDILKCALVEVGAALAHDKRVLIVGECASTKSTTLFAHKNVFKVNHLNDIFPPPPNKQP